MRALEVAAGAEPAWLVELRNEQQRSLDEAFEELGFVVLRIVFGTLADPTSHNLWPFEILQVALLSLVVIGVLLAARKFAGA